MSFVINAAYARLQRLYEQIAPSVKDIVFEGSVAAVALSTIATLAAKIGPKSEDPEKTVRALMAAAAGLGFWGGVKLSKDSLEVAEAKKTSPKNVLEVATKTCLATAVTLGAVLSGLSCAELLGVQGLGEAYLGERSTHLLRGAAQATILATPLVAASTEENGDDKQTPQRRVAHVGFLLGLGLGLASKADFYPKEIFLTGAVALAGSLGLIIAGVKSASVLREKADHQSLKKSS